MKDMNDPTRLSVFECASRIAKGKLTSEDLVKACLERIAERDPVVRAWEYLDPDKALVEARARDHSAISGPLHGIPVGLKDIIDTSDMPTRYGSPIYAGHTPRHNAACVERLRLAGAVILGKTVTTEFAAYCPGKTANPHNPAHTPGGSSSGSAAAVADFQVPLALGTQTGGSIIRPASFNGVIGYKPTYGALDYSGVHALSPSLDTLGVFVRCYADLYPLRKTLATEEPASLTEPATHPPRVGFVRTAFWEIVDIAMQSALENTATNLLKAGAAVRDVELPKTFADLVEAHKLVMAAEASRALSREWLEHPDQLSPDLVTLLHQGKAVGEVAEEAAIELVEECRRHLQQVFSVYDVLLTPAAIGEAPVGLNSTGDPLFNRIWTSLHLPCTTYPIGRGTHGLPLGAQVIGPIGGDDALIANAWWMERHSAEGNL